MASGQTIDFKSYRWQRHCRGLYQTAHSRINDEFAMDTSGQLHSTRRASAHVGDPKTTRKVPIKLSRFRCSGATRLGRNLSTSDILKTVNKGEVAKTAPNRDTSQCFRPSANAPCAASVLIQQNTSIES